MSINKRLQMAMMERFPLALASSTGKTIEMTNIDRRSARDGDPRSSGLYALLHNHYGIVSRVTRDKYGHPTSPRH